MRDRYALQVVVEGWKVTSRVRGWEGEVTRRRAELSSAQNLLRGPQSAGPPWRELIHARPRLTARCEGIESSTCKGPRAGVVRPVCPGQREPGTVCGAEVSTVGRAGPREEVEGGMQGLVRSVDFIPSLKRDGGGL